MGHLWEVDHDYYCNEGNFFSNDTVTEYRSWPEFVASEGDSDMDYNLVFRWDWKAIEEDDDGNPVGAPDGDDYYRGYHLSVFWMGQRKGLFRTSIIDVCRADEQSVIGFLRPRWEHLRGLWEPVGGDGDDPQGAPVPFLNDPVDGSEFPPTETEQ